MIRLDKAARAWGTPDFEAVLKQEVAGLRPGELPLQQGMTAGNYVLDAPVTLVVNRVEAADRLIRVRAAIFFQSVIAGCSCTDDPTPMSELNEYCEVRLEIDRDTAITEIRLAEE